MASFLRYLSFLLLLPVLHHHQAGALVPPLLNHKLASILGSLSYKHAASAAVSIPDYPSSAWSAPATIFAPADTDSADASFRLNDYIVPGLFTLTQLSALKPGTLIPTLAPGQCLSFTTTAAASVMVNSIPIVEPDMYINGPIVVHGIRSPIPPISCNPNEANPTGATATASSTAFNESEFQDAPSTAFIDDSVMQVMLLDAMLRLRENGYSILALAMRMKYADLVGLQNMTIFALDDSAIFAGGHAYVNSVRFHIVTDRYLTHADLMGLPAGTFLPTLARGERLVVTTPGIGLRINYVPIRSPDVLFNFKIVVHGVFFPFPHLGEPTPEMAPTLPPPRRRMISDVDLDDL